MFTTLIHLHSPFDLNNRTTKLVKVAGRIPLAEFLSQNVIIPPDMEYHASINGRVLTPDEIPMHEVSPGDCVVVCPVLKGGGGGSKNPLAILAGLALSIFSFGVVSPFVSGLFGGSAIAGSLAAGLTLMVGGQLISNAFAPSLSQPTDSADNSTSPSYGWGALQSITQQGAVIPITFGTIRTAGQVLNQHVSVVVTEPEEEGEEPEETQYLEMLLCGGEGPISSFSDVRINDNPISNYEDAQYFTRGGNNSQALIDGFENLYSTDAVGVTLDSSEGGGPGEYFAVEMTGDAADYLEMTVDFPQGLSYYSGTKAEPDEVTVQVQFEHAMEINDGVYGNWQSGPLLKVTAASINPITRTVRTDRLTSGRYKVRARVELKSQTDATKARTTTRWTSLTAVINSNMTHPNKALVAVRVKATDQLNGGAPTITWRQTRSTVLVWNGSAWVDKDAQNPAWIIYDLCVNARRLDGVVHVMGEDPSRMDYGAFLAWAAWNDRTLNNRPAMKMNLLVDESKSLWEWVNDIAASARGAVVMKGTKISCIWDQPANPVQLFSMGNIIAGSFSGEFLPIESRANAVEISYQNENNNFEREQITVYADSFNDSDSRSNPVAVELTGITDYERAYREGLYRLRQNKYILRTITFSAEVDAIACQVGDVISVQHDVPRWGRGGRIMAVDGNVLTLDNEVTFNAGLSYKIMVRGQDDTITEQTATGTGTTTQVTVPDASGIHPGDVFSFGEVNKVAKPFRVQTMSRNIDSQVTLTCSEYIPELYTDDGDIPVINYSEAVDQIAHLTLTPTGYYTQGGQWVPELWASWTYRGEKPASYQVEWKYDAGLWGERVNTMETAVQCTLRPSVGLYSVRVRALYPSALPSAWAYASAESSILGDGIPPSAPTNLTAQGWFGFAELRWTNPTDIDLAYIEVWENTTDTRETATLVGTTRGNAYTRLLGAGGTTFYWVRAVNYTGQKSAFNSESGTPCVIAPETHEAYVEELLRANPWLQSVLDDLAEGIDDINVQIEQLNPLSIMPRLDAVEEIIPELDGRIKDNQDNIQQNLYSAIDAVASGVLRLDDEAYRTRNVFRWAGIEVNEREGTVVIRGVEDLRTETGLEFGQVEQRLDAQDTSINLKASRTYVDEVAASLISAVMVAEEWKFTGTLGGWTGQNATLTATADGIEYAATGDDPSMTSPDININGADNNIIGIQLRQTAGAAISSITIRYKTADHGYSSEYQKVVPIIGDLNLSRAFQANMHILDAGGDDWQNSTITGIRLLIGHVGEQFLVPVVNIGQSTVNELALGDLELRVTQAEVDIDGANAAIRLKADETTVTALSQSLNSARLDIDALNAQVALKADRTEITGLDTRVEYAEIKADAALGYVSQAVADSILPQTQIDNVAEAAIQNAVNEAQNEERRRGAVAAAKQELHAEVLDAQHAAAEYRLELIAMVDGNKVIAEEQIRAVADDLTAEVIARQNLGARVNTNTAAIIAEQRARIDADNAEAAERRTLAAQVGNNTSAIQNEATARANADAAEVRARETLAAIVSDNSAAIVTERNARVSADTAEARAREALAADVSDNSAAIVAERNARVSADAAEASARQTLQATVGSNTSKIQTNSSAIATLNGNAAARWSVKADVNGNVAGIELFNGGASKSSFVVAADHFLVTPPGINSPTQVLDYNSSTGSLYIKNAYMDGAWINNATIGRLKVLHGQITYPQLSYARDIYTISRGGEFNALSLYIPSAGDGTPITFLYGGNVRFNTTSRIFWRIRFYRNNEMLTDPQFDTNEFSPTDPVLSFIDYPNISGNIQYRVSVMVESMTNDPSAKLYFGYPYLLGMAMYR